MHFSTIQSNIHSHLLYGVKSHGMTRATIQSNIHSHLLYGVKSHGMSKVTGKVNHFFKWPTTVSVLGQQNYFFPEIQCHVKMSFDD